MGDISNLVIQYLLTSTTRSWLSRWGRFIPESSHQLEQLGFCLLPCRLFLLFIVACQDPCPSLFPQSSYPQMLYLSPPAQCSSVSWTCMSSDSEFFFYLLDWIKVRFVICVCFVLCFVWNSSGCLVYSPWHGKFQNNPFNMYLYMKLGSWEGSLPPAK